MPDQAGHPLKTSSPEVWQELDALLAVDWPCESGGTMPIMAMTIDSGFRPQMVYEFAARHPQPAHGPAGDGISAPRTVVATKGKPDFLKLIARCRPRTLHASGRTSGSGTLARTGRSRSSTIGCGSCCLTMARYPPGYQHYAYKDHDFYRGLCSESRIIRANEAPPQTDEVYWFLANSQGCRRSASISLRLGVFA